MCFGDSWRWICTIRACFNSLNGLEHWNGFYALVLCQTKIVWWAGNVILKCVVKPGSVVPSCWWASNSRSRKRKSRASQETSDQGMGTFHLFLLFFCWKYINRECCCVSLPAHFVFQIIQGFLLSRWNSSLLYLCGYVFRLYYIVKVGWWWMMSWEPFRKGPSWTYWRKVWVFPWRFWIKNREPQNMSRPRFELCNSRIQD